MTDQLTDNAGDFTATKNFTAVPRFTIGSNEGYLNGHVTIFGMRNDITLGTNGFLNGQYSNVNSIAISNYGNANLYNLIVFPVQPTPATGGQYLSGSLFEQSIITGDTIHFNDQWAI